ncbi:MAG: heme NO-binding domain-containing protein [Myxococcota bacterium]
MKGMVFVELMDFIEDQFGFDVADNIIENADLSTGGAFTSVGTYPASDAVAIVVGLHEQTQLPIPDLLKTFGRHLFGQLAGAHPEFIEGVTSPFALLRQIENHIHVEVRKLYPDAELPTFQDDGSDRDDEMVLTYYSARGLGDLCEGLILGCFDHFDASVEIRREALDVEQCEAVRFHLRAA